MRKYHRVDREKAVALRKESVDRNLIGCIDRTINIMSLSARRAWIEMSESLLPYLSMAVALRKESVDRNIVFCLWAWMGGVALRKESVDRNSTSERLFIPSHVALRKESVDRNFPGTNIILCITGRSPQGERG